jgi:hypothetical protein
MADLQLSLTLPETLARRAQEARLLSNERIAALLTMEHASTEKHGASQATLRTRRAKLIVISIIILDIGHQALLCREIDHCK